jgi:UDP-glucose 4-epimerase
MSVLVTGAAGFLGSYVMAGLGARGQGYDARPPGREALAVAPGLAERFTLGDVTDAGRLEATCREARVEAIVHAAGLVGFEASFDRPLDFYHTNVMGFAAVCEAARRAGVQQLVLVSSNAVYHGPRGERLTETDCVFSIEQGNPAGHYGTSKLAQEAIGLAYSRFHGIEVTVLRVTALYGYGMRNPIHLQPMVEGAVAGRPVRLSGGRMRRDYTYVLDAANAVSEALAAARPSCVVNVAAGRLASAAEAAAIIRAIIPSADIAISDDLTPLEAENDAMRAPLDVTAAGYLLGWAPRWTLETGIRDYIERLRRHG